MTHKILVIDDHPETLSIIQNVLEQHGYDVDTARSGFRGLSMAESDPPDLVVVDGMMPEMDGWEVCRRLRENEKLTAIPIIMFSAVAEADLKLAGFTAGADDYLTKPTEPEELVERVEILLQSIAPRQKTGPAAAMKTQHMRLDPPAQAMTGQLSDEGTMIAVFGARGGAGATTLAINLAATLSRRSVPTTLVDLDQVQGHVALYLKQKVKTAVSFPPAPSTDSEALVIYNRHLRLLLSQANPLQLEPAQHDAQLLPFVMTLRRPGHAVVIDAGRGITAEKIAFIKRANQIILCMRPERVALATTKIMLGQWLHAGLPPANLFLVLVDFWGGREIPARAVEGYLGRPLSAIIPVSLQELTQAVNKGVPLIELYENGKTAERFKELALRLVKT